MIDCIYFRRLDFMPEIVQGKDEIWQCLNPAAQKAHGLESFFSEEYQQMFEGRLDYTGACKDCPYIESRQGKVIIDTSSTRTVLPQGLVESTPPERVLGFSNAIRGNDFGRRPRPKSLPPPYE